MSIRAGSAEDVAFRRIEGRLPVERVLKTAGSFCKVDRDEIMRRQRATLVRGLAARWLCIYSGLTQREVAKVLGLRTGAAISAQLRVLNARLASDEALSERVKIAEDRLNRHMR